VTSAQLRAARALLGWTIRDLAERSGVHRNTVARLESADPTTGHARAAIRAALEAAGVEFLDNGAGPGVRLRRDA